MDKYPPILGCVLASSYVIAYICWMKFRFYYIFTSFGTEISKISLPFWSSLLLGIAPRAISSAAWVM